MRHIRWLYGLLLIFLAGCATSTAPTNASVPTVVSAAPTSASAPAAASVPTAGGAIPQGLTPEGYHVLGRSDAPITMIFYSDFF